MHFWARGMITSFLCQTFILDPKKCQVQIKANCGPTVRYKAISSAPYRERID